MSKFKTSIPTDFKALLETLPDKAYIHSITFDRQYHPQTQKELPTKVIIEWEHEPYFSGRTVAVEYPIQLLSKGKIPKGIKDNTNRVKVVNGGTIFGSSESVPPPSIVSNRPVEGVPSDAA